MLKKVKKKKPVKEYTVYQITINGIVVYIGKTNDIKRRTREHNYALKNGLDRLLYKYLREIGFEGDIALEAIKTGLNKVDSTRYEAYMILKHYFDGVELKQMIPIIKDNRF